MTGDAASPSLRRAEQGATQAALEELGDDALIEVEVEDEAWCDVADVEGVTLRAARMAMTSVAGGRGGLRGACMILLAGDAEVQTLNARFRGKDAPTNVLSFPAAASAGPHLGDIALAHGVCAREAAAQSKPLAHHLSHLVVHGVLHLLGYDHAADAEAEAMEEMERVILARLGIGDPYNPPNLADAANARS